MFAVEAGEDELDDVQRNMLRHLRSLSRERDGYVTEIKSLTQALEELHQERQELQAVALKTSNSLTPPGAPASHASVSGASSGSSPDKTHLAVELADYKAKLRKLRQEA